LTVKFRFCLDRFESSKFWTWQWQKLKKSISQLPSRVAITAKSQTEISLSLMR
jgi:hypothetical protein